MKVEIKSWALKVNTSIFLEKSSRISAKQKVFVQKQNLCLNTTFLGI